MQKKNIVILGATGSIGKSTLDVISANAEQFEVFALCANENVGLMLQQCINFKPQYAVLNNAVAADKLSSELKQRNLLTQVLSGIDAFLEIVAHDHVDIVVSAIVGSAGLLPTLTAIKANKRVLLANKESLVMAGDLMMRAVRASSGVLLPLDSEHNAVFQVFPDTFLPGQSLPEDIDSIILTASGGPFFSLPHDQFTSITKKQALQHPNWDMGPKITIDSATMMNKGLEVIEAYWLFSPPSTDSIEVIVHPQSIIHSMVRFKDGSLKAQLGESDMRIPIAHSLGWPNCIGSGAQHLDLLSLPSLEFFEVDMLKFPCFKLAIDALQVGGTAMAALTIANELSVHLFLNDAISYSDIYRYIQTVMQSLDIDPLESIDQISEVEQQVRSIINQLTVVL